ncbi:ATP-grasp domain-containing protein [Fusobacterium perfoetens]|uniref:ATP-grasp domain-containing protein n=1 Tax=Fusobacterium perfoetens TaxID=852 RepID=UPI001F381203|nr:ATP-grasp domain-containing protein [Fusobacterium perfoetens]MCF2625519.1 ATP-grasp domain-containing protein [Fusobacterium perfoetens]
MNILLTSVGRRSYLVEYFKKALKEEGKVYVSNSSNLSPAFQYADEYVVTPLIYDKEYINFLQKYCLEKNIKAIISLFDIDLLVLSKHKKEFEKLGIRIIVSDEEVIKVCNDKWQTFLFLRENNFNVPETYINLNEAKNALEKGKINFPLMLKPRWGMGSISIYEAENIEELDIFYKKIDREIQKNYLKYESSQTIGENILIQEKLKGQEYGLDIVNDLEKNYCTTFVKRKNAMRSGETDCAETIDSLELRELGRQISSKMQHIGNLDVDLFLSEEKPYILEMNARFGGGYPFSHLAGANLPEVIIKWLKNEKLDDNKDLKIQYNVIGQKDIKIIKL